MRYVLFPALSAGVLFLFSAACGNSTSTGATTGATTGTGGSTGTGMLSCPDNLAEAPNSEFCAAEKTTPNCALVTGNYHEQVCGVPVLSPTVELARSSTVKEFAGSGPPDLACFTAGNYPKKGTSQTVKMSGTVKIFSHGCQSQNVKVEVFKVTGDADIEASPVGTPITTPGDCMNATVGVATDNSDCGTRWECKYSYDGVPSETELVIRTQGDFWAPLYDYNIYIPSAQVVGGVWSHDVRALATDDYSVIAQAAIGGPITPGNGAIAGEVHDCGDVRLNGATVDVEVQKKVVTYFTNNEDHPLPDLAATSTSTLGLYSALDVPPGPASVAALGLVGGKLTTAGYFRVKVFPDSVTAITFRGAPAQ
jgi:hypothetical protein